jgi:hypothetical protein
MYLRYFAWNFIGRQNDIQGLNGNPLEGNWKTGIKGLDDVFLDTDTSLVPHAMHLIIWQVIHFTPYHLF